MYELDEEQSKMEFYYHESNDRTTTLKTILYVCKVCCLKKPYEKPLINLDRLVITGKYQTEDLTV